MASLQEKKCGKYKYWYIVECRRIGGKPTPVVLEYLGTANRLLQRLRPPPVGPAAIKSYAHGAAAALLDLARELGVATLINAQVRSPRKYMANKPLRHGLTVGATLLLGAIGRACCPTSKRGWWEWARGTSCAYLLRQRLDSIDSQHFWDLMDALPTEAIEPLETQLLARLKTLVPLEPDTLLLDTTNFFTFIATTNARCSLAQRGKNKQHRADLRQVGLAMVVARRTGLPLFHVTYEGNRHDSKVFASILETVAGRLKALGLNPDQHTLVFDRGNNSKKNLALVDRLTLHYVGALTPYHHSNLIAAAKGHYQTVTVAGAPLDVYRTTRTLWGLERTLLVFVSDRLKEGQLRGIHQHLRRQEAALEKLREGLEKRPAAPEDRAALEQRIEQKLRGPFLDGLIQWNLHETPAGNLHLDFHVDQDKLAGVEKTLGFRILMTDRDAWSTAEIIEAFYAQAGVEDAFKNLKNPHHLAVRPQFHWTNQKIHVHFFLCVLGYALSVLLLQRARQRAAFTGCLDALLDRLGAIRLAAVTENPPRGGSAKITYQLEEMSPEESALLHALGLSDLHLRRPKISGISIYEDNPPKS
jgi:transposase